MGTETGARASLKTRKYYSIFRRIPATGHSKEYLQEPRLWTCRGCSTLVKSDNTGIMFGARQLKFLRKLTYSQSRWSSQFAYRERNRGKSCKTFYDILGLLPSATQREIKSAYYELSLKYHPDVSSSTEAQEQFAELTQAYNTLSRLDTRREYDKEIGTYYMTRNSTRDRSGSERVLRLMDDLVEVDMTGINQTSTFLNTAIPLSILLRIPVRLNNINGPKTSYGVQAQDIQMLNLLRKVCNGTLVANRGSSSVTFIPGESQGGLFTAEAGQVGDVSPLVETALPCLALGPEPTYSRANILHTKGTTHSMHGLHIDYIDKVHRPLVGNFGFQFAIEVKKKSFFPHCEGKAVIRSLPVTSLKAVNLTEPGALTRITGWAFVAGSKPVRVSQIMSKITRSALKDRFPSIAVNIESVRERDSRTVGTGQGVMMLGETSTGMLVSGTSLWKKGMSNEEVVQKAVDMFSHNAMNGACVDEQVLDKLIPYMALAKGQSLIRTSRVTSRATAAILAVEALTEARFQVTNDVSGNSKTVVISCEGLGLSNDYRDVANSTS